jgi:hypothetical protein
MKNIQQKISNKWTLVILIIIGMIVVGCYILNRPTESISDATSTVAEATDSSVSYSKYIDPNPATATTTATFNGYTINLVRDYDRQDGGTYGEAVSIRGKEGRTIFTASTADFFTLLPGYTFETAPIATAKDFITKSLKDVTADGIPDLTFVANTGGADGCCSTNYVIELGASSTVLMNLEDSRVNFVSNGNDKPMGVQAIDGHYVCWITDCADSPRPTTVLLFDKKTRGYVINTAEQKAAPTSAVIAAQAKGWTAYDWAGTGCSKEHNNGCLMPWAYALDLVYSGNAQAARKYIDLAWKSNDQFKSEDDFLSVFTSQIQSSSLYNLAPASFWGLQYFK